MDNFRIISRLIRGSIVGIVIGVIAGVGIPTAEVLREFRNETVETMTNTDNKYEQDVLNNYIRFHVRANSDSEDDLQLKYNVRDAVLDEIGNELENVNSKEEALQYLIENMYKIETIASQEIEREGYDYDINAYIGYEYFPMRQYGEVAFPAGIYQALRIDIGDAKGQNFWCLLYPNVCYPVDAYAIVPQDDARELEDELELDFKFIEWIKKRS